jgi:hypothetical protein
MKAKASIVSSLGPLVDHVVIHSGDWLIKLVLIPLAVALWPKQKLKSIASVLSQ